MIQPLALDNQKSKLFLVLSEAESKRIKDETAIIYDILLKTVQHVIATKSYEQFGFSPEIIKCIEQSWTEQTPLLAGRFDLRYHPDVPLKAYELNVLHAGAFRKRFSAELLGERPKKLGYDETFVDTITDSWVRIGEHAKGREIVYYGIPGDADADTLEFLKSKDIKIRRVGKIGYPKHDPFGLNRYLQYDPQKTLVVPPAWALLAENKAIWAHAWALFPNHPNLIPTFFEPTPFLPGQKLYDANKPYLCLAKPVFGSQSEGQLKIEDISQLDAIKTHRPKQRLIYADWAPELSYGAAQQLYLRGFVTGNEAPPTYDLINTAGFRWYLRKDATAPQRPMTVRKSQAQPTRDDAVDKPIPGSHNDLS